MDRIYFRAEGPTVCLVQVEGAFCLGQANGWAFGPKTSIAPVPRKTTIVSFEGDYAKIKN